MCWLISGYSVSNGFCRIFRPLLSGERHLLVVPYINTRTAPTCLVSTLEYLCVDINTKLVLFICNKVVFLENG